VTATPGRTIEKSEEFIFSDSHVSFLILKEGAALAAKVSLRLRLALAHDDDCHRTLIDLLAKNLKLEVSSAAPGKEFEKLQCFDSDYCSICG
jgi:hypothetical protein